MEGILNQVIEITRSAALAEMASGVAHELNQPLGAIATFAQAGVRMLDRPEPMITRALEVLQSINQEALNAGEGIRRIRRLFDQEETDRRLCRMDELIAELEPVLDLLSVRFNGRLQVEPTPESPLVNVDRAKIQHVLFALVQNGFEAAAGGAVPPVVRVSMRCDRYQVETSVIDSGLGVPDDVQHRLFRPFYTTKARGTGLGLASTRAILESHHGSIGFENLTEGGCRFWFRLPVAVG
ncbi:MAG TPA: HAMP domain-containing sensor histidine kinase [Steroidobacteraceae bacterium]|nr:HAMP domain-containing sensor histidine kinase [Steroidobacteraceae bacterium]